MRLSNYIPLSRPLRSDTKSSDLKTRHTDFHRYDEKEFKPPQQSV